MRDGRLSKEHFELIKEALKEEKNTDSASSPRKRRKVRQNEEPVIVISDSSDGELLGEDRACLLYTSFLPYRLFFLWYQTKNNVNMGEGY